MFWPSSQAMLGSLAAHNLVYGATILLGIGGSTLLVTSLSMVADLIGKHCVSWFTLKRVSNILLKKETYQFRVLHDYVMCFL